MLDKTIILKNKLNITQIQSRLFHIFEKSLKSRDQKNIVKPNLCLLCVVSEYQIFF